MADEKDNFQASFIYILEIDIKRGIDLISADVNGKSDPYVNVFCGNRKFQTIIQKKTLNPSWNAHTQFRFYQQPQEIKFIVKDWDKLGKPDPLGDYTLSLAGMFKDGGAKPFEGCVPLDNVDNGQIEIKVECKKISPVKLLTTSQRLQVECKENEKTIALKIAAVANANEQYKTTQDEYSAAQDKCNTAQTECDTVRQELRQYQTEGSNLDDQIRSLEREVNELQGKKESIKAQYKATKAELERCRGDAGKAEERKHRYMDSQGNVDKARLDIYTRIQNYNTQFSKGDDAEGYEVEITEEIVIGYAKKTREAKGYAQEEDKEAECERANNQAAKYMEQIREWSKTVDKELERAKDRYLVDLDVTESNDIDFFYPFFKSLCKFFFNTTIVAATMEQFGDEIKAKIKKKAKNITFYDLWSKPRKNNTTGGNDDDEDDEDEYDDDNVDEETRSAWNNVYSDLDFVMEELDTLLSQTVKNTPIMTLCNNTRDFMKVYFNGNYPKFSANVAYWTCELLKDGPTSETQVNHMTDDALGAIVFLYSDKKKFPEKLFKSIQKGKKQNSRRQNEESDNEESDDDGYGNNDDDDTKVSDDAFEIIIGQIVVSIATIIDKISVDHLTEQDKKTINEQRDLVLTKAEEQNIDADSYQLIKKFFGYIFDPKGSGGCCSCDGDGGEGGIMGFFGSLFGGLCKND